MVRIDTRTAPWRLAWLLQAPHRLAFFAAALMLTTSALWWTAMLAVRTWGVAPALQIAEPLAHALLMLQSEAQSLGLAPLHALTMGYLGATMFAMTTRVSSGHGGRAVATVGWAIRYGRWFGRPRADGRAG